MIARITGQLDELLDGAIILTAGAMAYEVLIPACDSERLPRRLGQPVTFHTIHYLEGDPSHGQVTPRLIGFLNETDRDFFRVFTTVKGIGVRKALGALVKPISEIAGAIQGKDAKALSALPGVGPRSAERIIADLHGKVDIFAGEFATTPQDEALSDAAAEAVAVLVQLGEKQADATTLVERVMAVAPELEKPEAIIQTAYKLKAGR
jgi:Holliday junction DNA helicase RuvA